MRRWTHGERSLSVIVSPRPIERDPVGWIRSEKGAALIEWALLVVLIAIIALIAVKFAGTQHSQLWSEIGNSLASP
jgi:Flp pilus assembly pilin Flp